MTETIFNLPEAYLPGLEKNELEKKMRLPQTSDAGYAAYLEVRHQLHCLVSPTPYTSTNPDILDRVPYDVGYTKTSM